MINPVEASDLTKKSAIQSIKMADKTWINSYEDSLGFSHLTCTCIIFGRKNWCPHVETIYKNDGLLGEQKPEWGPAIVVFRTPAWLIVPTIVVPLKLGQESDFFRVDILWGNAQRSGNEYQAKGGETIGYISREDRRKAIRSRLLEWLPALIYQDIKCESPLHSSGDSMLDNNSYRSDYLTLLDDSKRKMLTDAYNILDTGMCVNCSIASNAF